MLVDTNVISEVRKGDRCDRNVAAWYASVDDDDLYLSVLVIGEIRRGIAGVRGRDPARAELYAAWLDEVREAYEGRILPVTEEIAETWGDMNAHRRLPAVDSLLAATAQAHGLVLITRNVADIAATGVAALNPFDVNPNTRSS